MPVHTTLLLGGIPLDADWMAISNSGRRIGAPVEVFDRLRLACLETRQKTRWQMYWELIGSRYREWDDE
jgi:hypothetical protein